MNPETSSPTRPPEAGGGALDPPSECTDYEVGYGKPPKQHKFKPGQSGNPRGRPKKSKLNPYDLLSKPVEVRTGDKTRQMQPFEAAFRKLVNKALEGHMPSINKVIRHAEEFDLLTPPAPEESRVIRAPKGVDFSEWFNAVTEEIPDDELEDY